jgi:hypothetical protein
MADVCDTVQDALFILDAISIGLAQNAPSDNLLLISDAVKQGVAVRVLDTLTIGDALTEDWSMNVVEAMTIHDHTQDRLVTSTLARDRLLIRDVFVNGMTDKVVEAMTIADATSTRAKVTALVADALTIGEHTSMRAAVAALVADSLTISDKARGLLVVSEEVADALTLADAALVRAITGSIVTEAMTISDRALVLAAVAELVADALTIGDTATARLVANVLATDALLITDHATGGAPAAWSAHVEPFAMGRYTGFGFNSMASVNGYLLLASPSGLFVSSGNTDAGTAIAAQVDHDLSDIVPDGRGGMKTDEHLKRPRHLYMSIKANGQIAVSLGYVDGNDEATVTEGAITLAANQFRTARIPLSRGIRSRYLRPSLKNVSGANFSMNDASLTVDSIKRKV